ncbi:amino acid transporter [Meira miltonrushii]|uniref:Amino acid transporter n=1 Tax=Meira miltonrushii TaxID=1280837 RepID=A0A316VEL1_9BASI|nr:amino acid transporter [Meira miltonrushii]PWN35960.1 amino acid transporter [Meira miltonrushii]
MSLTNEKSDSGSTSSNERKFGGNAGNDQIVGAKVTERRVQANDEELNDDDAELARRTGHKSEFAREFRSFSTFSYACSIMGLISSVATTFNTPFQYGGPATTVWAWFLGSVMNLTLGASIAEIVSAYPSSGGLYSASGLLVPKRYRAITAWITGWLNFTGQIAGIAGSAYGLAQMMLAWATVLVDSRYSPTTAQTFGVYAAILIIHGFINCFPTRWLAGLTSSYVIINFGMVIISSILVLARTPKDEMHSASYVFGDVVNQSGWSSNGFVFFLGLQSVQFVMTDYDATAHISEEISKAAIAAPVAIFTAVLSTGIMGFFLNICYVFASGKVATTGTPDTWIGGLSFAQILFDRGGKVAFLVLWPFICSVAWFVVTTAIQANARSFYAFSRDRGLPDFGFFARVERRTGTTVNAVWLVVVLCLLLGCLSFINYTAVLAIFSLAAIGMDLSYIIPILARQFFEHHPDVQFQPGPFFMGRKWWARTIVWISVFWVLFETTVLSFPLYSSVDKNSMNWGAIVMFGVLIVTGIWYFAYAHRHYHGPRSTLTKEMAEKLGIVTDADNNIIGHEEHEKERVVQEEK